MGLDQEPDSLTISAHWPEQFRFLKDKLFAQIHLDFWDGPIPVAHLAKLPFSSGSDLTKTKPK